MIKHDVVFLEVGKPSYSGVIFDEIAATKIMEAYKQREVYGYFNNNSINSKPTHMITNINRVGDRLMGKVVILESNPESLDLAEAIERGKNIHFAPSGFGRIVDNVITDFQFMGINAVLDNIEVI